METGGTGLKVETGGGSIADERGVSTGWRRGVGGGSVTLWCVW